MIQNYIKVAFRSLIRNKISTITNIIGLSISMVVGVLLFAMVKSNWETDHFHPQINKTFRILTQLHKDNTLWATAPEPLVSPIQKLSYIESSTIVRHGGNIDISAGSGPIPVSVTFSEPSFFNLFGFKLISGDARKALGEPNSVLISAVTAERLFGTQNALGRSVKFDGWGSFQVGGVIEKPVLKTHLPIDVLFSLKAATALEKKNLIPVQSNKWATYKTSAIYARTSSADDAQRFNTALQRISSEINKTKIEKYTFSAQNIEAITPWNPAIKNDLHAGMHQQAAMTWIFLALALTLLAAFNYTALSMARILSRAKEVGIRKTNGALQKQIFFQFIVESVLLSLFALLIAYLVVFGLRQSGGISIGREINITPDIYFIPMLLGYTLLTGLIAGIIPAFFLSKFKPVDVLKNLKNLRFSRRINLYRAISVVQFSVTIMLMIFFLILKDTVNSSHEALVRKLPKNITVIDLKTKPEALLKSQIAQLSAVSKISCSDFLPVNNPVEKCTLKITKPETETVVHSAFIDHNFLDIFNLKLAAGSNFPDTSNPEIEQYILLNASAARLLNKGSFPQDRLIGQSVSLDTIHVQIIGILADESFHAPEIAPTVFRFKNQKARFITIKGISGSDPHILSSAKKLWQSNYPDFIPEIYSYKDRMISKSETGEAAFSLPFGILCSIVMLITCLGILGMTNYAVQSNSVPISIRKTFGADNKQILTSVTTPFIKLLLISGIFGIPLGWLCGSLLKTRFAAHVDLGVSNLLTGYAIVLIVALAVTVSQTLRAVYINPAKILRGE
ncbi:ABC transporter permease [Dyadobacter sp. LHD-138]|uniref:ABC transporter permease n=1 Tax=Dyadobacter sp. LHD-138 TaxID=3071413 RepID=UPI0027DEDDD2|nr:ABC transporter permease [Dyadobacter sp. LHD-138]MDQ6481551.1 ABC transporter permease [Dyadobacter sp. LHD-138]